MIKKYIHNILIATDQWINCLLGGDPDETLSSRIGKNYKGTVLETIVNKIFKITKNQDNHCEVSIETDEGKNAILK